MRGCRAVNCQELHSWNHTNVTRTQKYRNPTFTTVILQNGSQESPPPSPFKESLPPNPRIFYFKQLFFPLSRPPPLFPPPFPLYGGFFPQPQISWPTPKAGVPPPPPPQRTGSTLGQNSAPAPKAAPVLPPPPPRLLKRSGPEKGFRRRSVPPAKPRNQPNNPPFFPPLFLDGF